MFNENSDCHLILGDSAELLKSIPDNSVDLIMTSPPYADRRKNSYRGIHPNEYVEWFLPISEELYRILKPEGSFILNIKENVIDGQRHTYVMELVLEMLKQDWKWTEEYIWHKTTATPGKWPNRFRDSWEHLYHFTKQKKFVMNQDAVKVPIGNWAKSRLNKLSEKDQKRHNSQTGSGVGRNISAWTDKTTVYPTNVLHGAAETQNKGHSAVYPTWLPEWFIKLFTNENSVVLDPFMGSGTTAVAALRNNRRIIGIEEDLDIFNHSITRIKNETSE